MVEAAPESPVAPGPAVVKAHCAQCRGPRNCDVRGSHSDTWDQEELWTNTTWRILQCRGCDHVFAQTVATNSEDVFWSPGEDGQDVGTYVEKVSYWPALAKRPRPEWLRQHAIEGIGILTGESLCSTLHELYQALDGDMNVLAAIGVRTCFDIASEILGVDGALTFEEKLKTLVASSHIRLVDADRLAVAVDAGHASAHRGGSRIRLS